MRFRKRGSFLVFCTGCNCFRGRVRRVYDWVPAPQLHTTPKKYCLLRDPGRMQAEDTPFQTYIQ